MISERGISIDHSTIYRWVQKYAPILEKRSRSHLKKSGGSYRVDETYIKVKGQCKYLYRAVDKTGQTIPYVINVDLNAAYPVAIHDLQYKQWFRNYHSAQNTISGYEAMHMIKKGQIKHVAKGDIFAQNKFIDHLFADAA